MRWSLTVYASDYEASKTFYRDILGMDVTESGPDSCGLVRDGLALQLEGGAKRRKRRRSWMQDAGVYLTLTPASFDDLHAELVRRGATFLGEIAVGPDDKRYAGLADPDGLLIEIAEA
jgi:catechol 2,3-dioxygenase-like lactoylglutathione lyase family enzyme